MESSCRDLVTGALPLRLTLTEKQPEGTGIYLGRTVNFGETMSVFQEAEVGQVFKVKNEDDFRCFNAIILGHNGQYPCGTSPRLNEWLLNINP